MCGTAMVGDLITSVSKGPAPVSRACIKRADDLAVAPDDQRPLKIFEFVCGTATRVEVRDKPAGGATIGRDFGIFNAGLVSLVGYKRFLAIVQNHMDIAVLVRMDAKYGFG